MSDQYQNDQERHNHCTIQFINLANALREQQDFSPQLVSAGLMAASGIYATYVAAGNQGGLEQSCVDKVVKHYRETLEHIQLRKRASLEGTMDEKDLPPDPALNF